MLNHNILQERLNAVKTGNNIHKPVKPSEINQQMNAITDNSNISVNHILIIETYNIIRIILVSFLYGYGVKSIFSQDWDLLGIISIGFLIDYAISTITNLFKK